MSLLIAFMKIAGTALSGVFGVIGTIHDFKNKKGEVTRWGKLAISGLSISVVCAISAQTWETWDKKRKAEAAAIETLESTRRIERLLSEVDRAIRPIETVEIFVSDLFVPKNDPVVAPYFARVASVVTPFIRSYLELGPDSVDYGEMEGKGFRFRVFGVTDDGRQIPNSADLFGDLKPEESNRVLSAALSIYFAVVKIYRPETDMAELVSNKRRSTKKADLELNLQPNPNLAREGLGLQFVLDPVDPDVDQADLSFVGNLSSDDKSDWTGKGTVVSEPDLRGAWVVVEFSPYGVKHDEENAFGRIRSGLELTSLKLRVNSRELWLREHAIKKHIRDDGNPIWIIQLDEDDPFIPAGRLIGRR